VTRRVQVLNGSFDALTLGQTVDAIFAALAAGKRGWVCTVNVATLMSMRRDRDMQAYVDRAAIVVADGQPLVWCAPMFGGCLPERVAGVDLIDEICARAARDGTGIFMLGSTAPLLSRALRNLRFRHRGLRIDGADGYFAAAAAAGRVDAVRSGGARILFVGMGSPLQEEFIRSHWDQLGVDIAIGVGGSFDIFAGARFRAPRLLRRAGLEWLVRLVQEPRRLLPRYLWTNTWFCLLIAQALGRACVVRIRRWVAKT
jgi:N-acetylglucosaminyldiphosphoundecaprenol N-acetyl-beta-D-mannosaminyltransferase